MASISEYLDRSSFASGIGLLCLWNRTLFLAGLFCLWNRYDTSVSRQARRREHFSRLPQGRWGGERPGHTHTDTNTRTSHPAPRHITQSQKRAHALCPHRSYHLLSISLYPPPAPPPQPRTGHHSSGTSAPRRHDPQSRSCSVPAGTHMLRPTTRQPCPTLDFGSRLIYIYMYIYIYIHTYIYIYT